MIICEFYMVKIGYGLGDGQSQSGRFLLSGITFIETFEYLLFVKCLVSIVDYFDSGRMDNDVYASMVRAMYDGIFDEVSQ